MRIKILLLLLLLMAILMCIYLVYNGLFDVQVLAVVLIVEVPWLGTVHLALLVIQVLTQMMSIVTGNYKQQLPIR